MWNSKLNLSILWLKPITEIRAISLIIISRKNQFVKYILYVFTMFNLKRKQKPSYFCLTFLSFIVFAYSLNLFSFILPSPVIFSYSVIGCHSSATPTVTYEYTRFLYGMQARSFSCAVTRKTPREYYQRTVTHAVINCFL